MEKEKNQEVEIDLLDLGSKTVSGIGKGIKALYDFAIRAFEGILYFFLRNRIQFLVVVFIGLVISGVSYKMKKQFFHSEMIAYSSIAANSEIIKSINSWNYTREFNEADVENIKSVSASFLLDVNEDGNWDVIEGQETVTALDTTLGSRVNGVFAVIVEVYDTALVMPIKEKLMNYVFSSEKVQRRNNERIIELDRMQAKIGDQLLLLDSLQKYEYYKQDDPMIMPATGGSNMLILQKKDKRLYHENIIALYKQQIELKRQIIANPDPYDIRVDLSVPKQGSITVANEIKKNVLLVFAIGLLFIFLRDRWKIIKINIKESDDQKL